MRVWPNCAVPHTHPGRGPDYTTCMCITNNILKIQLTVHLLNNFMYTHHVSVSATGGWALREYSYKLSLLF